MGRLGDDEQQQERPPRSGPWRWLGGSVVVGALAFRDKRLDGQLYARLGRLAVGVALQEGERTLRFWQPRRWFEQRAPATPHNAGMDDEAMIEMLPDEWRAWTKE